MDWGTSKDRPDRLDLWSKTPDAPKNLYFVASKEDGTSYYASKKLHHSSSARWLASCDLSLEALYARMQLLLTPTPSSLATGGVDMEFRPGRQNHVLKDLDDGMATASRGHIGSIRL